MVDKAKPKNCLRSTEVFKTLAHLQTPINREKFRRMWAAVQHYLNIASWRECRQKGIGVVPPAAALFINALWYAHSAKALNTCGNKNIQHLA